MSGDAWKEGGIDATGKHTCSLSLCLALPSLKATTLVISDSLFYDVTSDLKNLLIENVHYFGT